MKVIRFRLQDSEHIIFTTQKREFIGGNGDWTIKGSGRECLPWISRKLDMLAQKIRASQVITEKDWDIAFEFAKCSLCGKPTIASYWGSHTFYGKKHAFCGEDCRAKGTRVP